MQPGAREPGRLPALLAVVLVATALAYLPSLGNGFTNWDDTSYVHENPWIAEPSAPLGGLFSAYHMGNYHPLTLLSFVADHALFGLDPRGYHAVNLVLHLLVTAGVFVLVRLLTSRLDAPFVAALLFGLHPLHVESVAWISERKDLLYTLFYLGALICWVIRNRRRGSAGLYVASLLLFVLALGSKALAVTLPVVLLLVDRLLGRALTPRALLDKLPYFAVALVGGLVAIDAQASMQAVLGQEVVGLGARAIVGGYGLAMYLGKLVAPLGLSALYPYPSGLSDGLPAGYVAAALVAGLLVLLLLLARRRFPRLFFGGAFFLVTLAPVLQFLPVGGAVMADRYAYLPSVGISYLVGLGWSVWAEREGQRTLGRRVVATLLLAYLVVLGGLTWQRTRVWHDSVTLWNDVIDKAPTAALAYFNRGSAWGARGDHERAVADFTEVLRLFPTDADSYLNRGRAQDRLGRPDLAVQDFTSAIDLNPDDAASWHGRGRAFVLLGDPERGLGDLDRALSLDPLDKATWVDRAVARGRIGRTSEAIDDLDAALALRCFEARGRGGRASPLVRRGTRADDGSVARQVRVDGLGPGVDAADQVAHPTEALLQQKVRHHRAAASHVAVDDDVRLAVELVDARGDVLHRDQARALQMADRPFLLGPHVEQQRNVPSGDLAL